MISSYISYHMISVSDQIALFNQKKLFPKSQTRWVVSIILLIFLPYLGKIPILTNHFSDGSRNFPQIPNLLRRSWVLGKLPTLPTLHSRRSIHSPRDLYIDPPNINMEIGWHLSFLPLNENADGNKGNSMGGEKFGGF